MASAAAEALQLGQTSGIENEKIAPDRSRQYKETG
jgi:hypothetical protein